LSILEDQLIGSRTMMFHTVVDRDAFHFMGQVADESAASPYFNGFTYAADPNQAFLFRATPVEARTGPRLGGPLVNNGSNDQKYGPESTRRMGSEGTTILGIIAGMIHSQDHLDGEIPLWQTAGEGKNMAATFTSGDQMRSLWNSTNGSDNNPMASGGTFRGYQRSNQYAINNWDAVGWTAAVAAVTRHMGDMEASQGNYQDDPRYDADSKRYTEQAAQAAFYGVTGKEEVTRPSVTVSTGIRGLPGMMAVGSP